MVLWFFHFCFSCYFFIACFLSPKHFILCHFNENNVSHICDLSVVPSNTVFCQKHITGALHWMMNQSHQKIAYGNFKLWVWQWCSNNAQMTLKWLSNDAWMMHKWRSHNAHKMQRRLSHFVLCTGWDSLSKSGPVTSRGKILILFLCTFGPR